MPLSALFKIFRAMDNSLNSLYVKTNPNYRPPTPLWSPINNRFYIEPSVVILLRHLQASMLNVLLLKTGAIESFIVR